MNYSEYEASDNKLWIDKENAGSILDSKSLSDSVKSALNSLMTDGLAVVKDSIPASLCSDVIEDYSRYSKEFADYVSENLDVLGREKRLVNFHHYSKAAERVGTNPKVMEILDALFETESIVYTSLTFKYGTQQPVHRDTPHFATWPHSRFVGVWTALEDVDPSAGPLFYHPGAHRFEVDPKDFWEEAVRQRPNATIQEQRLLALDLYNGEIIRTAPTVSEPKTIDLKAGDSVIWHPQLPHGGSPALNPHHTRWSMVFHCAPINVQVHQHDAFFSNFKNVVPSDRYGYRESMDRKLAVAGGVSFMD